MEELADVVLDDAPEQDEITSALLGLVAEGNVAGKNARHLDHGQIRIDPLALEMDDDVQTLVQELREGMRRVDRQRRQHRKDPIVEKLLDVGPLGFRKVGVVVKADVLGGELGLDLLVPAAVLVGDLTAHAFQDGGELRLGGHAVRGEGDGALLDLLLETADTDLEELVKVGADDAEELQSLEQGILLVEGLVENALVELQPAQAAVDEMGMVRLVHRHPTMP